MTEAIGNEANMDKVREMMLTKTAEELNIGDKATNSVAIDFTSEYGTRYQGNVVFKRPNVMEFMKMGGIKSEILRQAGVQDVKLVDLGVKYVAQVIATLKTVVVKSPEWLVNIDAVQDTDLLFYVHDAYEGWEHSFRLTTGPGKDAGDSQTTE